MITRRLTLTTLALVFGAGLAAQAAAAPPRRAPKKPAKQVSAPAGSARSSVRSGRGATVKRGAARTSRVRSSSGRRRAPGTAARSPSSSGRAVRASSTMRRQRQAVLRELKREISARRGRRAKPGSVPGYIAAPTPHYQPARRLEAPRPRYQPLPSRPKSAYNQTSLKPQDPSASPYGKLTLRSPYQPGPAPDGPKVHLRFVQTPGSPYARIVRVRPSGASGGYESAASALRGGAR